MPRVRSRRFRVAVAFAALILIAIITPSGNTQAQVALGLYANFEGAQTNPIRLSADRTLLFAVNTPDASLSVFDLTQPAAPALVAQIPVGLEPVSVNPRTNDEVWVVNQVSNTVSVVSVSQGIVTDTIQAGIEPMDVVFAGGLAYVSVSRSNQIAAFDVTTHARKATINLFGDNPRALAVSADGTKVYAAFTLSGNSTTLIPSYLAPPQSAPTNPNLPPPPQVGLIVKSSDPNWTSSLNYSMADYDVAVISAGAKPTLAGYYSGVGTTNRGIAVNPFTGDIFVANTDALNLTHFEPNVRSHFINSRITKISVATGQITPFDLNPGINYSVLPNPSALTTALAEPTALAFDALGQSMWVAAFGTDRVARVNTSGQVQNVVEVAQASGAGGNVDPKNKRGPRGLALSAPTKKLYVLNRLTDSISVVDTGQNTVLTEIPVGFDPTPTAIRQGRGFLYDAKLSGNGTGSCASCHIDGDMDHLAWDLGDPGGNMTSVTQGSQTFQFHPMKGPMTTQTLRGLANMSPYHWRGDHINFAAFNSGFSTLLGGSQLSTADMNTYTTFVNYLLFLPNPYENKDRTMPTSLNNGNPTNGQNVFNNVALTHFTSAASTCASCHAGTPGSNRAINFAAGTPQPLKNPQLRNMYQKTLRTPFITLSGLSVVDGFGMDHDGNVSSLTAFFDATIFADYSAQQQADMAAYLLCFDTGTAPAVGFTQTVAPYSVSIPAVQSNWTLLQSQATAGNISVIASGTVNGQVTQLIYHPLINGYVTAGGVFFSQAQLQTLIQNGDTITFMGVYPGTPASIQQNLGALAHVRPARKYSLARVFAAIR